MREQAETSVETEEPFRAVYQRLLARRRELWKKNRHVENAKKRKNDAFVNGTEQGRAKALAKKAAKAKPAKEPASPRTRVRVEVAHLLDPVPPPALAESAPVPLEVAAYAYARAGLTRLPVAPLLDGPPQPRRRGRPPGSRNKKCREEEPA